MHPTVRQAMRLFSEGKLPSALHECEKVLAADATDKDAWMLLGALRHARQELTEAVRAFDQAILLDAGFAMAASAKAAVLVELGRAAEAEATLRNALILSSEDPALLANLANLAEAAGKSGEAVELYAAALAAKPDFYPALLNLGGLHLRMGRLREALQVNRRLSELYPDSLDALTNFSEALLAGYLYEEAAAVTARIMGIDAAHAKSRLFHAAALAALGRQAEAARHFDKAIELDPAMRQSLAAGMLATHVAGKYEVDARSFCLHMLYRSSEVCDWSTRNELVATLQARAQEAKDEGTRIADPSLAFLTFALPIAEESRLALASGIAREFAGKPAQSATPGRLRSRSSGRIRVGYLTPDFGRHAGGFLTRRLYGLHDRSRFEIYGYAFSPDDGSRIRSGIEQDCDVFRDVCRLSGGQIVDAVRRDEIDIAVDLSGYTRFARPEVFAARAAPVQVNYLGFPGTLGAGYMDYAIVDHVVCPPGAERFWKEQLVRMPGAYLVTDNREPVRSESWDRRSLGLPEDAFVFCCFNGAYKIDPETFDVWMRLLRKVEGSVLWLLAANERMAANLSREAAGRGVDPARMVFAPHVGEHETHLGRYRYADIFLDTRYCNAHTTAVDALWAGLPLLTVPGETMPSRVAASLLTAVGLPELVCRDHSEFENLALRLAAGPEALAAVRNKLAASLPSARLFDTEGQVRALETAYEEMSRRSRAGLPPAGFDVASAPGTWNNRWH